MPDVAPHDWLRPKLAALMAEAEAAGIARDIFVAGVTDIVNGPRFSVGPTETDENWNKDLGEPDEFVNKNEPLSAEPSIGASVPNPMDNIGNRRRWR